MGKNGRNTHEYDVLYENIGRERDAIMHTLHFGQAVQKMVSHMHRRCRQQENGDCRNNKGDSMQATQITTGHRGQLQAAMEEWQWQ